MRQIIWGMALAMVAMPGAALAQDAAAGEQVFRKCKSCHQVGEGARHRTGPILTGVVGQQAGSAEGFRYSDSMTAAGEAGLIWDQDKIADYIADPTGYLRDVLDDPGARARMTFRLRDAEERRDVAAYLATFSDMAEDEAGMVRELAPVSVAATEICVRNANATPHLFGVEAEGAERKVSMLAPGETLCTEVPDAAKGVVSVWENAEAFEGCSRLVPVGQVEDMLKYVDFDRCFWSSNT